MILRDHLGPRTPESAALHDELDRLEMAYGPESPETGNPIVDALTTHWGERCDTYEPGCPCCDAWAEYDRLLAARAVALEEARNRINETIAERQADLHGARNDFNKGAVDGLMEGHARIRALASTNSAAALDRVIRAHVEKALEMAKRSIVPDMTYKVEWQSSRGELVLNVEQILTEPVVARARLIWETSKEEAFAASGDTVEEAISRCIAWAAENAYEVPEAAPQPVTADDVLREMGGRGNG